MSQRVDLRDAATLAGLGFILLVTVGWWALALWPVPGEVPRWLAVTRAACFGAAPNGLPQPAGWLLLVGQPPAMIIALILIAGETLPGALRRLAAGPAGRLTLAGSATLVIVGLGAAGVRVAGATATPADPYGAAAAWEPVSGPIPSLELTDQHGTPFAVSALAGRPALVTFAFGHCTTVCPLIVHEVKRARTLVPGIPVSIVVVTLDPWRDTPQRLASIADRWDLGEHGYLLGGSVEQVESVLDAWNVPRSRDQLTGDVTHGTPVYLVGPDGRLAYRAGAAPDTLASLLRTL